MSYVSEVPKELTRKCKFVGSDNVIVEAPYNVACMNKTIKDAFDETDQNASAASGGSQEPLMLPNLTGEELKMVFRWCEYHLNFPVERNFSCSQYVSGYVSTPDVSSKSGSTLLLSEFDQRMLMDLRIKEILALLKAAQYLNNADMEYCIVTAIGYHIKNKSVDEIRDYMGL